MHATRRRKIHEAEARSLDRVRCYLGTFAAIMAAAAGTSAFAAWQTGSKSVAVGVATAFVGIAATVLGSAMTFVDPGGRAEAHRRAASDYKDVMREFEEAISRSGPSQCPGVEVLSRLKQLLSKADRAAPTVPLKRGQKVEKEPFSFIGKAEELTPNPSGAPEASDAARL